MSRAVALYDAGTAIRAVAASGEQLAGAEAELLDAIDRARACGWSWADLAEALDLSGDNARRLFWRLHHRVRTARARRGR